MKIRENREIEVKTRGFKFFSSLIKKYESFMWSFVWSFVDFVDFIDFVDYGDSVDFGDLVKFFGDKMPNEELRSKMDNDYNDMEEYKERNEKLRITEFDVHLFDSNVVVSSHFIN